MLQWVVLSLKFRQFVVDPLEGDFPENPKQKDPCPDRWPPGWVRLPGEEEVEEEKPVSENSE